MGFIIAWATFVTAPPDGIVAPSRIVISILAVASLLFLGFAYLKHSIEAADTPA